MYGCNIVNIHVQSDIRMDFFMMLSICIMIYALKKDAVRRKITKSMAMLNPFK